MDLLRAFREPHDTKTPVTQDDLNTWVAQLNDYNNETWKPSNVLGNDGIISDALYYELEAKFIKYVEELDVGTSPVSYTHLDVYKRQGKSDSPVLRRDQRAHSGRRGGRAGV